MHTVQIQNLSLRLLRNNLVTTHKVSSDTGHLEPFLLVLRVRLSLKFIRKHLMRKLVVILRIFIIAQLIH
jgi:hypothetical protein